MCAYVLDRPNESMVRPTAPEMVPCSEFTGPITSMCEMVNTFNPEGASSENINPTISTPACYEIAPSDSVSCVEVAQRSKNGPVEGKKNIKIFFEKYELKMWFT